MTARLESFRYIATVVDGWETPVLPFGALFTNVEIVATNKRLQNVSVGFNRDFGWHWWRTVEQWDVSS